MPENPIDIASSADRLRRLQQLSLRAEREGNGSLAAHCIQMAAKEQNAQSAGGGHQGASATNAMTPEEARGVIREFLTRYHAHLDRAKEDGGTRGEADGSHWPAQA